MISENALKTNSSSSRESPKVLSLNWRVRPGLMPHTPRSFEVTVKEVAAFLRGL